MCIRLNILKSLEYRKRNNKEITGSEFEEEEYTCKYASSVNEKMALKYSTFPFLAFERLWNYFKCLDDHLNTTYENTLTISERDSLLDGIYLSSLDVKDERYFECNEEIEEQQNLNKRMAISMLRVFATRFEKSVEKLGMLEIEENYPFLLDLIENQVTPVNIKIKAIQTLSNKRLKKNKEVGRFLRDLLIDPALKSFVLNTLIFIRDNESLEMIYDLACKNVQNYHELKIYVHAISLILRTHIDILSFSRKILEVANEESFIVCLSLFSQIGCFQLICQRNSKLETAKYVEHILEIFDGISKRFDDFTDNLMLNFFYTIDSLFSSPHLVNVCTNSICSKRFEKLASTLLDLNYKYHQELPLKGSNFDIWLTRASCSFLNFYEKCFFELPKLLRFYDYLFISMFASSAQMLTFIWYSTSVSSVVFKDPLVHSIVQKILLDLSFIPSYTIPKVTEDVVFKEKDKVCSVHSLVSILFSLWEEKLSEKKENKKVSNDLQSENNYFEDFSFYQKFPLYKIKNYQDDQLFEQQNQKRDRDNDEKDGDKNDFEEKKKKRKENLNN
eukprot:TRINITY_DN1501_c0_g1_i3.p1 TRINITY_DN1501_c0_g1~~TRINITY_DN1501_c0_g1_i3.p1  ORF type:complete len:559 (-),score=187.63 TRINITY_DN1501_c0_g1_i3:25-1701(-)